MNDGLTHFFRQNLWANLRLLDECAVLTDEQLDATLDGTYGSVRVTLMHIFAGEESYVQHFTGQRPEPALRANIPFVGFDALRRRARQNGESLIALAGQWAEGDMLHIPEDGEIFDIPAIIVLIQAINHGTDHRSQIATILGQQGIEFPELSGWRYFDETNETEATG
jgi:uncharacterized damage-inducible protein DinB